MWPARYTSADLRKDLLGGLMAAFVLFPLSIGYGLISGLGAVAGLYGGIALSLAAPSERGRRWYAVRIS